MQNNVSPYPLATGELAAARLALIECVCGAWGREAMRSLGVLPGMRVADIGCGTGETTRWLASQVGQRGQVAAVDFSADQLRVAGKRLDLDGHRNVRFIEASAYATGLPKAAFDMVHCRFLNDAIASRAFHTGHHARDLFARDPGRAASRSGKRREARIWTQMDPSSGSDANSNR